MIPLPFGRGLFVWGRPVTVSASAGPEEIELKRRELEAELNRITNDADTAVST